MGKNDERGKVMLQARWEQPGGFFRLFIGTPVILKLEDRTLSWEREDGSNKISILLDPRLVRMEANRYESELTLIIRSSFPREGPVRRERFTCVHSSIYLAFEQAIFRVLGMMTHSPGAPPLVKLPPLGIKAEERSRQTGQLKHISSRLYPLLRIGDPDSIFLRQVEVGQGAFGYVLLANDASQGGLQVAVKCVNTALNCRREMKHFGQEIMLHAKLQHPNIITYLYSLVWQSKLYLVLNYCDGGSLAEVARHCVMTEELLGYFVSSILRGLAYLHSRGIVHRDIKLENILLSSHGGVQIADLGLSCDYEPGLNAHAGTLGYMSPEMLRHEEYGYSTDLFSLGVLMYRLAFSESIFSYASNFLFRLFHLAYDPFISLEPPPNAPPAQVVQLSAHALNFLASLLETNQHLRPSAQSLLQHPFVHFNLPNNFLRTIEVALSSTNLEKMGF